MSKSQTTNTKNVILVTGVSGSGKSTVGITLAKRLRASFYDADGFHPESNIAKMSSGIPLTDADRQPWLQAINSFAKAKLATETIVVACSALKESYRKMLSADIHPTSIIWIHLQGDYDLLYQRMRKREGHFMTAAMLRSQMDAYEMPEYGIPINVNQDLNQTINQIMSKMEIIKSDVGLVGLGVMGTSLARNIAGKGFSISIYNRPVAKGVGVAKQMKDKYTELYQSKPFDDLKEFVKSLKSPRKIILMVTAGKAVDDMIEKLLPLLDSGDVVIDAGNSHYTDTNRRQEQLTTQGLHFVGIGVSGGEEGALLGPSIMPGGSKQGFELVKDILLAIAAKNNLNEVCCDYIGDGGAGHFVKMVHNGIEYAEMQLIAEFYSHLRYDKKTRPEEIAKIFNGWNQGDASSYLLGITVDILRFKDVDGLPLIDKISDVAGNKGTGSWTTIAACELGVPIPAIAEALFSRYLSSFRNDRLHYSNLYVNEPSSFIIESENLLQTYMFCRIINHYQGLKLIQEASEKFGWNIDTAVLLRIWSGGCIIRSTLLSILRNGGFNQHSDVLQHAYTQELIQAHLPIIKDTVAKLMLSKGAYPVMSSCLDYFKYLISPRSNAYMIQAQRDYFGAHTYKRTDDPTGTSHHTQWVLLEPNNG